MIKKLFLLLITMLLLSGCSRTQDIAILSSFLENAVNESEVLWEVDNVTGYIQPKDFEINNTVRVFDLIIESPNSLIIGGVENGTPFATIGAFEQTFNATDTFKRFIKLDSDTIIQKALNGTLFLTSFNLDNSPNSSAVVSASDPNGFGMVLQKFNKNYMSPYKGVVASFLGDMDIMTTYDNTGADTGDNKISIGFYQNLSVTPDSRLEAYNNKDIVLEMNHTLMTVNKGTVFKDYISFNETYIYTSNPALRTSPDTRSGESIIFARNDGNFYSKKDNGDIQKFVLAGTGSYIFSEEVIVNNHTQLIGNMLLDNDIYKKGGNSFVCVDEFGRVFVSRTACDITTDNFEYATIENSTIGYEISH